MRKLFMMVIPLLFACLATALAFWTIRVIRDRYTPETRKEVFFQPGIVHLVFEGIHVTQYPPPIPMGGEVLLPFDMVKEFIDPTLFYDGERAKITITTPDKLIRLANEELEAFVNLEPFLLDASARYVDGVLYLPVMVFREIFRIDVQFLEEEQVVIVDRWKNYRHEGVLLGEDAIIRKGPTIKHPVFKVYDPEDNRVLVLGSYGLWTKVRTRTGIIGYVETRFLHTSIRTVRLEIELIREVPRRPNPVVLAWQYIHRVTPPPETMQQLPAINVLSPTWFTVISADGTLNNRADLSYVHRARELGYQVWPLINNTFRDIEMTSAFLNDTNAREHIIRQLLAFAALYDFEGINVNFENIFLADRNVLTQFMRELRPLAKLQNLVVSIAVGVPDGSETYSLCYDHRALGEISDYVMVMTYDQHWSTSPVAGSQAQLSWVENRLRRTLEMVDPAKLILGIPFYTRIWEIRGSAVRNIRTVGIDAARSIIARENARVIWDVASGQYVVSYERDGALYRFWMEEETSIGLKAGLAKKYGLAGVAVWELSLGNQQAWNAIAESLSGIGE